MTQHLSSSEREHDLTRSQETKEIKEDKKISRAKRWYSLESVDGCCAPLWKTLRTECRLGDLRRLLYPFAFPAKQQVLGSWTWFFSHREGGDGARCSRRDGFCAMWGQDVIWSNDKHPKSCLWDLVLLWQKGWEALREHHYNFLHKNKWSESSSSANYQVSRSPFYNLV